MLSELSHFPTKTTIIVGASPPFGREKIQIPVPILYIIRFSVQTHGSPGAKTIAIFHSILVIFGEKNVEN